MESEQEFLQEVAKKRAFLEQLEQEHYIKMKKYLMLLLEEYKHYPILYLNYLKNDPYLSQLFITYTNDDNIIKNNINASIIYNGDNLINKLTNALNKESNKDCMTIKKIIHFNKIFDNNLKDFVKNNNINNENIKNNK